MRINIWVLVAIIMLSVIPAGVQAQSDEGLVAEWHFDEGSGNVVKDSSGNGNDGIIYGASWVDGKFGKALSFDGKDDSIKNVWNQAFNSELTISLWFKSSGGGGGRYPRLFEFSDPTGSSSYSTALAYDSDGSLRAWTECKTSGKRSGVIDYSGTTYDDNIWHLGTYTYDGNTGILYIDGVLKQSAADNPCSDIYDGKTFVIGNYYPGGYSFNGIIDEVRIYNRALTVEEIKEHYENGPTALSITKIATPNSIKQGQTTTITLTMKNTGSTEITDIEIADTIPSYLTFIDGETSKRYDSLAPKDTRQFYYTLQLNDAGTFNLEPAIATYANDKGNYNTVKSKPESIEVIRSIIENSALTPTNAGSNAQSASVNLHGEKTDVLLGEDVLLKLSAVNIIGNPTMHVQVIIIPPSGWSVTSSEFAKSGAGQYTTTYELESGGGKDIEVRIVPNQIGDDFQVEGRIIYYFGDDVSTREDHTLSLPIKVRAESDDGQKPSTDSEESKTPGFGVLVAVIGLLMTAHLIKRK